MYEYKDKNMAPISPIIDNTYVTSKKNILQSVKP